MESLEVRRHNETVLSSLEEGDLVEFLRGGDDTVVHVTGINDEGIKQQTNVTHIFSCCGLSFNKAVVRKDNFFKVAGKDKAKCNNSLDEKKNPASRREIVRKAKSRLDEVGYNLIWKNCEHFATWCRYGEASSDQSDFWVTAGLVAGGVLLVAAVGGASYMRNRKQNQ
ncbi:hypothetical protein C0Q70_17368 [Pomacea canaliculata]|uniref:LRAT domain-containing protein n=1 Tax=Pomacea canaliculata TaxID=400727 RepID=A0A2T7NK67_POMCA|nr:hypothetical protein C0Q70_17368 [Pomacea canaliculata]